MSRITDDLRAAAESERSRAAMCGCHWCKQPRCIACRKGIELADRLSAHADDIGRDQQDAARFRWLCSLKSGRTESQIALAQVILAMRKNPEAVCIFIDEQIAAAKALTGEPRG